MSKERERAEAAEMRAEERMNEVGMALSDARDNAEKNPTEAAHRKAARAGYKESVAWWKYAQARAEAVRLLREEEKGESK